MSIHNEKYFCLAPFLTKRYFFNNFSVCPGEERDHFLFNDNEITGKTIEDVINSEKYNIIRKKFLSGDGINEMCKTCIKFTDLGFGLVREFFFNNYADNAKEILQNINKDGSIVDPKKLKFLSVTFDNLCNLKCRFCDPERSSLIMKEALPFVKVNYDVNYNMGDENFKKSLNDCREADTIQFTSAGEPFINPKLYEILTTLIKENNTNKTIMFYTNASVTKHKIYDIVEILSKFKKVLIFASIDGLGKHNKIIRHNLVNFSTIVENLKRLKSLPNLHLTIHPTLSIYNYFNLTTLHKFFIKTGLINYNDFNFIPVFNEDLSVHNLPHNLKNKLIEHFTNHINWLKSNNYVTEKNLMGKKPVDLFKAGIEYTKHNKTFDLNEIKKRIKITDRTRNVNSLILNEIDKLFNEK
jgi:MoaA/NifB/PqqE/SkfB family radical SAM enzyme